MRPCCGQSAGRFAPTPEASSQPGEAASAPPPIPFTSARAVSARGAITGRVYHFAGAGAVVPVDPRDAPGLAAVPLVRRALRSG